MQKINLKNTTFFAIFIALGFAAMQVPFSQILGVTNLKFSLFDFYGPMAGAFFSSFVGLLVVLAMQLVNWMTHGFNLDLITFLRFLPMLAAVLYFAKNTTKWSLIVPGIAMIMFWSHPEGRGAWYYALYWTIPFVAYFVSKKSVLAKALGATFTAHSVGSVIFLYALNLKSVVWTGLMPIVWKERMLMAIGITATFYLMNSLLNWLVNKKHITLPFVQLKTSVK